MRVVIFLQSWSEIFYLNFGGCDSYPSEYLIYDGKDNSTILRAFPNVANPFEAVQTQFGSFYLPICSQPSKNPVAATIIFVSFAILGGYILVSLSLAAVAIGINERLEDLRTAQLYGNDNAQIDVQEKVRRSSVVDAQKHNTKAMKLFGGQKEAQQLKKFLERVRMSILHVDMHERTLVTMQICLCVPAVSQIWHGTAESTFLDSTVTSRTFAQTVASRLNKIASDWRYQVFVFLCMFIEVILQILDEDGSFQKNPEQVHALHVFFQVILSIDCCLAPVVLYHEFGKTRQIPLW